jgi:rare lipoprotein A
MKTIQNLFYAITLLCIFNSQIYAITPPELGLASYYDDKFHGQKTASGELYNKTELTAAHRTLPFGTMVKIKAQKTGKEVTVRINDRGPFAKGRIIDLSRAAAEQLDILQEGQAKVEVTVITNPAAEPIKDKNDSNAIAKTEEAKKVAEEAKKIGDAKLLSEEAKKIGDAKLLAEEAKKAAGADKKTTDAKTAEAKKLTDKKTTDAKIAEAESKKLTDKKTTDAKILDDKKKNSSGDKDMAKTTKMAKGLDKTKNENEGKNENDKARTDNKTATNGKNANKTTNNKVVSSIKQGGLYKMQATELEKKGFGVQIAGYSDYETVLVELEKLEVQGYKATLVFVDELNGKNFYKIILGPFINKDYADAECKKFEQKTKLKDAFVVNLETLNLKANPNNLDKKPIPAKGKTATKGNK